MFFDSKNNEQFLSNGYEVTGCWGCTGVCFAQCTGSCRGVCESCRWSCTAGVNVSF